MDFIYADKRIAVCIKPSGVLSTDEPGGMPELIRKALGTPCCRSVHRLDRVVSGLMVYALSARAASILSEEIRKDEFTKEYLAVIHGTPDSPEGEMRDYLSRDPKEKKTFVAPGPGKDAREAVLSYSVLASENDLSLVRIKLITGRTHQIRAQFSSRALPLVGDRKYSSLDDGCPIALWSYRLAFTHPESGEKTEFRKTPPPEGPWALFEDALSKL